MTNEAKVLTGIIVVTIVLIIGAVFFLSKPEKPVIIDSSHLLKDDALQISTPSAKLTIVEFGDLQCPACKLAHPGLKQIMTEYAGKINFVFRNYPLPQHQNAIAGAQAVEAARAQGKGWEMFDKLYDAQEEWGESTNPLDHFKEYAKELGMDPDKLLSDMKDPKITDKINRDQTDGNTVGVNSTPTLFFNNEQYKGSTGYADLKAEVDSKLK